MSYRVLAMKIMINGYNNYYGVNIYFVEEYLVFLEKTSVFKLKIRQTAKQ